MLHHDSIPAHVLIRSRRTYSESCRRLTAAGIGIVGDPVVSHDGMRLYHAAADHVGATAAYALLLTGTVSELILVDRDRREERQSLRHSAEIVKHYVDDAVHQQGAV